MIPIELTLKNFMSYGEEGATLPFEGLRVACLSGDNGNGKSALLDAITWALWGETRASSVGGISDDDLIRLGSDEMEVRFAFELAGQRYRVVRKRKRGRAGASDWQLAQQDERGNYVPIGGSTQRETKDQIRRLLSMTYETFLNSAYLQQGRADEFTRQKPAERKRILGEILGLARYDRLEEKAKERAKAARERADELDREIRLLEAEAHRKPEHQACLEKARAALAELEAQAARQSETVKTLREQHSRLEAVARQVEEIENLLRRLLAERQQREKELSAKQARLEELRQVRAQREAILGDYRALQEARRQRDQLEPDLAEFHRVTAELQKVIGELEKEETRLRGDLRLRENELKTAEHQAQEASRLEKRLTELDAQLRAEAGLNAALHEAQAELQAAQEAFAQLKARHEAVKKAQEELEEILHILESPRPVCPVCDSDLSGKQAAVIARQQNKLAALKSERETLRREGVAKQQAQKQAQGRVQELTGQAQALVAQRSEWETLAARRQQLAGAAQEAARLKKETETLRVQIEKGEFAAPKRLQKQRLEKEQERLGKIKEEADRLTQRLRHLEGAETRYQQLQQAEAAWEQENSARTELERLVAKKGAEIATEEARLSQLRAGLTQYAEVQPALEAAEAERERLRGEIEAAKLEAARFTEYMERCDRAAAEARLKSEHRRKADEERKLYQALTLAFGKKGVQALIIENTLEELEDDTNALLARMTEGALQVRFQTTRKARTRDSEIETLDIHVMDDIGTRPYELFSGGEGFRVNFAIRIALSRLLARRSGAKLQTLIMDEGFGSQDGKGREKLVEVIETIRHDFEKILVITHFEEMKDAFAQRIEVVKGANGSRIHML